MKYYYAEARLSGKVVLIAGPFADYASAAYGLETITPHVLKQWGELFKGASFGVMEVAKDIGPGQYNEYLTNFKIVDAN